MTAIKTAMSSLSLRMTVLSCTVLLMLSVFQAIAQDSGAGVVECVTLTSDQKSARDAAIRFLKLLDDAKYGDAWDISAPRSKQHISKSDFITMMQPRGQMGKAIGRTLTSVHATKMFPSMPDGNYIALRFEAEFGGAPYPYVMEGVLLEIDESGVWRVINMFGS